MNQSTEFAPDGHEQCLRCGYLIITTEWERFKFTPPGCPGCGLKGWRLPHKPAADAVPETKDQWVERMGRSTGYSVGFLKALWTEATRRAGGDQSAFLRLTAHLHRPPTLGGRK